MSVSSGPFKLQKSMSCSPPCSVGILANTNQWLSLESSQPLTRALLLSKISLDLHVKIGFGFHFSVCFTMIHRKLSRCLFLWFFSPSFFSEICIFSCFYSLWQLLPFLRNSIFLRLQQKFTFKWE